MAGQNMSLCSDLGQDQLFNFRFYINGPLSLMVIALGLIGNVYSCRFLRPKSLTTRFAKLSVLLGTWDTLLLLSAFHLYVLPTLVTGTKPWKGQIIYFYLVFYPLSNAAMTGGKWTILLLTWQRFMAVKYPFKQRFLEAQPAKRVIVALVCFTLLTCVPLCFELTVSKCFSLENANIIPVIGLSDIRRNPYYAYIYRIGILLLLDALLPFGSVFVLTVLAIFTKKSPLLAEIKSTTDDEQQRVRKAKIMLAVIVKYLVCYSVPISLNVIETLVPKFYYQPYVETVVDIANFLVVLHSGTNWLMFGRYGSQTATAPVQKQSDMLPLLPRVRKVSRVDSGPVLNARQAAILTELLEDKDMQEVGLKVLQSAIDNNPTLLETLGRGGEIENMNRTIDRHGRYIIGSFLSKISQDVCGSKGSLMLIRHELRRVGFKHFARGVTMRNSDWGAIKTALLDNILNGQNSLEDIEVAQKFVSLIISEIKNGFLCQAVHQAQESLSVI